MNVHLTPELERLVHDKVETGYYTSASEVVRDALRLLADRDEARRLQIAAMQEKIAEGLRSIERGDIVDGDEAERELQAKSRARRAGQ